MAYVSSTTTMQDCPPLPECPECGGLECLCRPRFFAGQLLTEQDLNRLESYIVEKNKLHNRYLHGWGVVCGLQVVCSPCTSMVQVKSGYALSPCGEDIVVCEDTTVDIRALIQACRPKSRYPACEPAYSGGGESCQEATEEWVLAICYDEQPARNVSTLRGGGSSSTCGCHASSAGKNAYRPATKPSVPQCEPTLTCEGYVYRVYKAPKKEVGANPGAFVKNFEACLQELIQAVPKPIRATHAYCCNLKKALQDFLVTHEIDDCLLADKLANVPCPEDSASPQDWQNALNQFVSLGAEYIRHCRCLALLPPCPEPVTDDCVPLATLTVSRRDYRVIQVCNWGSRRFAVTFPNLGYWLSWTPVVELLPAIEKFCCPVGETVTMPSAADFYKLSAEAFSPTNRQRKINDQTLLLGKVGATDANRTPVMSEMELAHPLQFLLLNQLVVPLVDSFLPEQAAKLGEAPAPTGATAEAPATPAELAALRDTVTQLQSALAQQQARIDELNARLAKG